MKKIIILLFILTLSTASAWADSNMVLSERLDKVEKALDGSLFKNIEISGAIEAEAFYSDSDEATASDIDLSTFDLGIDVSLSDSISAFGVMTWDSEEDSFGLDEGGIVFGNSEEGLSLTVGRLYVPFGVYETAMISDPLTLELGETNEGSAVVSYSANGLSASAYLFNGLDDEADDDNINSFGLDIGYALETESFTLSLNAGWISNILSAGAFGDYDEAEPTSGAAFSLVASLADFTLIGEYIVVLSDDYDDTTDAEPSAYNIELNYAFEVAEKSAVVAVGYQATDEAADFGLAEERYLASFGVDLIDGLNLSLEYAHDEGYEDESADTLTCLLALEF